MGNCFWWSLGWGAQIAVYMEGSHTWCIFPFLWFFSSFKYVYFAHPNPLLFAVKARPSLKRWYEERVQAALDFSFSNEDFDELVDPRSLYDHYLDLNLQPSSSSCFLGLRGVSFGLQSFTSSLFFLHHSFMTYLFCFADMATCFSQDRYARAKEKKNQPLSKISSPPPKKQKVGVSGGIVISSPVHTPL